MIPKTARSILVLCLPFLASPLFAGEEVPANFRRENLVAWCIVPFDAKQRGPAERARMLEDLGIGRMAYDWRPNHIPTFEAEIRAMEEHGIEFFAFWRGHKEAGRLFRKYGLHPQIWHTARSRDRGSREERIAAAVRLLEPHARSAGELGSALGLYNHGGWGGEPENLVAVCQGLREMGHEHVGIVYNWHHGHGHIEDWPETFALLKPYLLCLNLNGMNPGAKPKILSLSQGEHELAMLKTVLEAGYDGPVGILDHRKDMDTHESLRQNLVGLEWLFREAMNPGSAGEKPDFSASAK